MNEGRPLGIYLLILLAIRQFLGSLSQVSIDLDSVTIVPAISGIILTSVLWEVISVFLSLFIIYGFWNLKTWGWKVAVIFYLLDVVMGGTFLFLTLDTIITVIGLTGPMAAAFRSSIFTGFFIGTILSIIAIIYVLSKQNHFIN